MAKKKFLPTEWNAFYEKHLVSATVESAAAQNVVMTFVPANCVKAFSRSVHGEFTLVGKTVDSLTLNYALGTVTVHVTVAYVAGANFDLTHNPATPNKGNTTVTTVTNNVA